MPNANEMTLTDLVATVLGVQAAQDVVQSVAIAPQLIQISDNRV